MAAMLSHFLLLAAAGAAVAAMLEWSHRRAVLHRLQLAAGNAADAEAHSGPLAALAWIGSRLPGARDGATRTVLVQAGYFHPASVPVFLALRLLVAGGVFFLTLFQSGFAVGVPEVLSALFLAFFASRLVLILLKLRVEARQRQIRRELPPVVDIMLMVLNSGVSIDQCLRYVTGMLDRTAPLVAAVFRRYAADIDSGMPYETAFERMGQRLGVDEGYDLAALIKQGLLQGGEVVAALERFGAEASDKRIAIAREQIGRKSILLTVVMLAFFMPVLMIILAGPAVTDILQTLATVKTNLIHKDASP